MPGSSSNTLYEVSFKGAVSTINTFIRCLAPQGINGCIYLPDSKLWSGVAISNAGQGEVLLTVRGTDDTGTSVGDSGTFHMSFSKSPIEGALYYWTTSGKTAIMRWDFGGSTTTSVSYLTPANTDGTTCVGCHALAPDGTKLVASAGGQNDGHLLLWDIVKNQAMQPYPLAQQSQFESWNADGTQFVGVYGDATHMAPSNLMIFDGTMGTVVSTIDLGGLRADHPDWSKNMNGANTIAFTSVDPVANTTDQRPATGGIDFIQNSGGTWSAPQVLVPSLLGKNRYYPAIAPDGNLLVYDESTCTNGTPTAGQPADKSCDADTDATATIMITSLQGDGADSADQRQQPRRGRRDDDRAHQLVPQVGPVRRAARRAEQAPLAHLLVDAAVRAAHAAGARRHRRDHQGDADLDGRDQAVDRRRRPQLHRLLPAVSGHHHLQSHRAVDAGLHPGSRLDQIAGGTGPAGGPERQGSPGVGTRTS